MPLTTYGSVRSAVSGASVAAQSGGSTTQSKTLHCWVLTVNRVGVSLPTALGSVTISAGEKLVFQVASTGWNTASEDTRAFLFAASEVDDVSTATILARVETRQSKLITYQTGAIAYANEGSPNTFPLTVELLTDEQLKTSDADLTIADESSYPTGTDLVDGMIRSVTSLAGILKQYRVSSASWETVSGRRVNLVDTRQQRSGQLYAGGADQLVASDAELLYPLPPYPALDSSPQDPGLLLWFNNGLAFDGGDVTAAGTQLLIELTQNGSTALAPKLNEKLSVTLIGYVDRATAVLDTSMTGVGAPVYFNAADQRLSLPVDLPRGSAAIYLVQFRFKASEVSGIGSTPFQVTVKERGVVGTYNPSSSEPFVFDEGDRCLVVPDAPNGIRRLGGRVHTGLYDSPTLTSSQSRFGLTVNTGLQKAVLTADSGGDLTIKVPSDNLRSNEGLRALVSTDGDSSSGLLSSASAWSSAATVDAGELLQVTLSYPCDADGLGTIRGDYPDVAIAGNSQGDFNPPSIRVFARVSGVIYQIPVDISVVPDVEQAVLITDDIAATWSTVGALPAAADADFCLFNPPTLVAAAQSGSSAIPDGTSVEIAVCYVFDGDEVTRISHDVSLGCMPIAGNTTQLSRLATYFGIPQQTVGQVRAIAQSERSPYKELYCVQLGNITRWDATETSLTELVFEFESSTAAAASARALRFNSDLTQVYVSTTDEESLEVLSVLSQVVAGTQIQIDFESSSTSYRLTAATQAITDNSGSGYYTIDVALVATSGALPPAGTRVALSVDTSFIRPWDAQRATPGRWVKDDSDQILSLQSNPASSLGEVGDLAVIINDGLTTYGDVLKKTAATTWTTLFNFLPYSLTTASFTQPAVDANVTASVRNSRLFPADSFVQIEGGGIYQVVSRPSSTSLQLRNTGNTINAAVSATVASGGRTYNSGSQGAPGSSAIALSTANFTQPAEGATVAVAVDSTQGFVAGQYLYTDAATGNDYQIAAIDSATQFTLRNLQGQDNAAAGTVIPSGSKFVPTGRGGGDANSSTPVAQTTASRTLTTNDIGKTIVVDSSDERAIEIPTNASAAIAVGSLVRVFRKGTGQTVIRPASGVTINGLARDAAQQVQSSKQYGVIELWQQAANTWFASRDWESAATTLASLLENGLLGWWSFEDNLNDSGAGGITLTKEGAAAAEVYATTPIGRAVDVTSFNHAFTAINSSLDNIHASGFYAACLFRVANFNDANNPIVFGQLRTGAGGLSKWAMQVNNFAAPRGMRIYTVDASGNFAFAQADIPSTWSTSAWYLAEAYFDPSVGSHGQLGIALNNGAFQTVNLAAAMVATDTATTPIAIGNSMRLLSGSTIAGQNDFNGLIDVAAIWGAVPSDLSPTGPERAALWNSGNFVNLPGDA
ncbi:MAG: hypothetical protein AAFO83_00100 [Cyanobacteria bacterium J06607_13]